MTNGKRAGMAEDAVAQTSGRPKWLIALVVALVAGSAFGIQRWHYGSTHESTDDASIGGHLVPVVAKVGGFVGEVSVTENQHVDGGQALVALDTTELAQHVRQAEADVLVARSQAGAGGVLGQAQSRVAQAASQRESLAAQIQAAHANQTRAEKDLERIRGLAEKEIVPRQQLDAAQAALESARATVASLEQQRTGAAAGVTTAQGGVKEYEARLQSAETSLAAAQLQLSYARILAPVAGQVSKRSVEPGQLLQAGQPLLTIVADSGTFVNANFKETQLSDIRAGQPVEIEVDAYDGCEAKGEVSGIGGATGSQFALIPADNATGNFTKVVQRVPVRIKLTEGCGEERPLRPGMSVTVHIATGGA